MKNLYPKKSLSLILIIVLSCGIWPVPAEAAGPTVVTLGASGDAWVDENSPSSNHSAASDIEVYSKKDKNQRGLIYFDLSPIPSNAIISSAVLSLYMKSNSSDNRTVEAHRITTTWSESTANWSNQPAFDSTVSGSVFTGITSSDRWVDFTLTSDVSAMVAGTYSSYGWALKDSSEGLTTSGQKTNFRSRDFNNSEFRPKLTITYTLPPTGSVSGSVFEDSDGNGGKNGSETGLSGWDVTISGTGDVSDVVQTTTTGADGVYSFSALPDGTYHVCQSVKSEAPAWSATKTSGYDCGGTFGYEVTLTGGAESGYDFGNLQYGSVTIAVVTDPSSSAETFSVYLDSTASPAPLSNGGSYTFVAVVPGNHSATEDLPTDWVTSAVCSDGSPISAIEVGKGEEVTCTFTNTQKGKMIVQKTTLPSEDPTEFAFTGDLSTVSLNEGVGLSDGETMELLALPGTYTSLETPVAGWDLTDVSCDSVNGVGSVADSSATFNLSAGETIHCTFTNTKRATLEIVNIVEPNEGVFGYSITGPSSIAPASFVGNGSSTYENILPGVYNISETLPDGFDGTESASCTDDGSSDPRGSSITLEPGSHVVCTYNHGAFGVINGKVFNDKNQNSQKDKGEGSLSGWTINLFSDGETDPISALVTTKAGYEFRSLSPGVYNVCQVLKPLWHQTLPLTGVSCPDGTGYQLDLRAGEIKSNIDFGNYKNGTISGRIFSDLNGNSIRNSGEPWLSGWEVKLLSEDGTIVIDTETTNSAGKYQFTDVTPGTYTVAETVQTGWVKTLPTSASHTVTVASNQTKKNINFGNYHDTVAPTVSVGFGNGNTPANSGPEHDSMHNGTVPVYVTVTDMFPSGFHLRVVKDGGNQGHSCGDSLSAPENQGYGGCGYVYNMVVSTTTSLTNYHLVDLNTADFGGDGDYWIILGAVDSSGNRTDSNYLNDPKVKITVDHTYNVDQTAPDVPTLEFPDDGALVKPSALILDWSSVSDPSSPVVYYYQSAYSGATTTDNALSSPIYTSGPLSDSQIDGTGSADAIYFWQVRACDSVGNCSLWSDPHQVTVDSLAPVSTITSPNPDSVIENEFITISGVTTDANGVASTTLAFATYNPEGEGSCGAYSFITSLINSPVSNQFDWTYDWTPEEDGVFCLTSHGQDTAGNEEASPFVMNIQFKKVSKTVPPTDTSETTSNQSGGGGGSSAPAGNGPVVGFAVPQAHTPSGGSLENGSPIALNSETFSPTNQPVGQGQNQNNGNVGNPGGAAPETTAGEALTTPEEDITPAEDEALSSDQVAASVLAGNWFTWKKGLGFLALLVLLTLLVLFWRRRGKNSPLEKAGGMY